MNQEHSWSLSRMLIMSHAEPAAQSDSGPRCPGETRTVDLGKGVTLDLVWIPPGEFMMGSPDDEHGTRCGEGPVHKVRITRGFWMGKYPVTQAQWETQISNNPSRFKGDDNPVGSFGTLARVFKELSQKDTATSTGYKRNGIRLPGG